MTDLYAVLGNPIAHSRSPQIHLSFAQQEGVSIRYHRILVPDGEFKQTIEQFALAGGLGANVTLPNKIDAYQLCVEHTARAQKAGAVNTLIPHPESNQAHTLWIGDNTDGQGLVNDIERLGINIQSKNILLLGAGGAARGVIQPLLDKNPNNIVLANRTYDKAYNLAQIFQIEASRLEHINNQGQFDIIINSTSASLNNLTLPLDNQIFAGALLAYDMVYAAKDTAFIQQAKQAECPQCADGLGMLIGQAAESYYLWRGFKADIQAVLTKLRSEL